MKLLVGITSFGTAHAAYLDCVLKAYKAMACDSYILIFTEQWRQMRPDVIQVVKEVGHDPHSLTWAHRERFAQHQDEFDYFLYAEDDILITERNLMAWIEANEALGNDETLVPAFFVRETAPDGRPNYPQVHASFHWAPPVIEAGAHRFCHFTNVHPACCMLSQRQLKRAIASGKYVAGPHWSGPYATRELACSGAFYECGLTSLVDLSRFHEMTVEHLPGNYVGVLGVGREEIERQMARL